MNAVAESPDGTVSITKAEKAGIDLSRYQRFREGESIPEMARRDDVDPATVQRSVRAGQQIYEVQQQLKLRDLKYDTAIENEVLRKALRDKVAVQLVEAIETLLSGKRTVVEVDKITGAVSFKEFTDPDVISLGIDHAIKSLSFAERPASNQTIVNVQQNNNPGGGDGSSDGAGSYEERLERIRSRQRPKSNVINVTATDVTEETVTAVEAELVVDEPEELGF